MAPRGADPAALNRTAGKPLTGQPMAITLDWWRYFLKQDPGWMWSGVSRPQYEQLWDQSVEEFGSVLATDTADLAGFRDRGGKAILWHGWADQLIYAQGTIDYYQRVRERMGDKTPGFLRLFMAPGVAHCRGDPGPQPTGQFEALVKWVENGIVPEMPIAAGKTSAGATRSRPLCPYPLVARYKGSGNIDEASSFTCSSSF